MAAKSIVQYFPDREGYKCGYCGNEDTSLSQGMWAHSLSVQDYQDLIDRGWRRSGKYVYKPTMDKTCCPQYTIKCEMLNYTMNKSHKKVIKRVHKYLRTGVKPGESHKGDDTSQVEEDMVDGAMPRDLCDIPSELIHGEPSLAIPKDIDMSKLTKPSLATSSTREKCHIGKLQKGSALSVKKTSYDEGSANNQKDDNGSSKKISRLGDGPDPSRPKCKKAKLLRKERWLKKQSQKQSTSQENKKEKGYVPKTLEQFLSEANIEKPTHKLETRLVRTNPRSNEFNESFKESHAVYKKYQMKVHNDSPDKPTEKQYTRFLVDSPLQPYHRPGGAEHGYGSFHQQYWLDGKLIAVGVLDILPQCVSSVYLYYDPDYFFLSPGTYSALREMAFTRQLHQSEPSIIYYYMGYYIHSCPKMRYKGQYNPSYLGCPETYTWHRVKDCAPKLDVNKYSRFAEPGIEDADKVISLDEVSILFMRQAMPYAIYRALNADEDDENEVNNYAKLTGKTLSKNMLLYREAPAF